MDVTGLRRIGRVYAGVVAGREVAVKLLPRGTVPVLPPEHPFVVAVHDHGTTTDGRPYVVMELCAGSYAERGLVPPDEVRAVGAKVADALGAAHRAGVLHGDVKPGNILLGRDGQPRLADFDAEPGRALTPAYTAPEVFRGEPYTAAADVYALGATLYALLAGRPPGWPAVGIPGTDAPRADAPPELLGILARAMATDPADRYATADELRDALSGPGGPVARGPG